MTREYNPFTAAEDKAILDDPRPDAEIAVDINRTVKQIRARRYALKGGSGQHERQAWDQAADRAILHPDRPSDQELSAQLGRSVPAIQIRRSRLGAIAGA